MDSTEIGQRYTAFVGESRIVSGDLAEVARAVKAGGHDVCEKAVLIFDDRTGEQKDVCFQGSLDAVLERLETPQGSTSSGSERAGSQSGSAPAGTPSATKRGPGRPKLGVVGREVTLLPRHWEWLARQPGGASVALRKLVEAARRAGMAQGRVRESQEAAYRFMSAIAGNLPGFEEATRALFAKDRGRFRELVEAWPADIRDYSATLADGAFSEERAESRE
ncbi:DUF2239 family protein [Oceanidesulfovibrio marinus]|uniref:DUF2239 domain-containing protein n=1 Tax=Oceanidesulfovibrio marinus TaxID=370038 RepID=A0A6P1ZMZ4_9BACT|nr:DUF2239 family protein [Oceanidesulfovibrio marinus]TVM36870.1 DUF2239 domain-containing protein [Oceanidesulfovibrio marinus]